MSAKLLVFLNLCFGILAGDTIVIAHRGNSSEAPENTLASFLQAAELGADYIEFDVRLTRDKVAVVHHDSILLRTTDNDEPVPINEVDSEDLAGFDAGSWFDPAFTGESVPTLEDALNLPLGQTGFMVEVKPDGSDRTEISESVARAIQNAAVAAPLVVGSLDPLILKLIRQLLPDLPIIAIVECEELIELHESNRPDLFALCKSLVTVDMINRIHSQGKGVWVWTVDNEEEIEKLSMLGVDGIITNRPRTALLMRKTSPVNAH